MQISGLYPLRFSKGRSRGGPQESVSKTRYPQLVAVRVLHAHILRNTAVYKKHAQECWERRGGPKSVGVNEGIQKRQKLSQGLMDVRQIRL